MGTCLYRKDDKLGTQLRTPRQQWSCDEIRWASWEYQSLSRRIGPSLEEARLRRCLVHGTGLRPRLKDLHVISKVPIAKSRTSPPEDYPELNHKAERSHYHWKESVMNTSTHQQQGNQINSHHQIKSQSFPMKAAQGCRPLLTRGWGYLGQHEKLTSNFPDLKLNQQWFWEHR